MSQELRTQALESANNLAEATMVGSFVLTVAGLGVAVGDILTNAGQDLLHAEVTNKIAESHAIFDAVGHYGIKGIVVGYAGVIGGVLAAKYTDKLRGIR